MSTSDETDAYQSYLLRLWRARCQGEWQWRASIESRRTGEHQVFGSLEQLFAFLGERCEDQTPGVPEAEKEVQRGGDTRKEVTSQIKAHRHGMYKRTSIRTHLQEMPKGEVRMNKLSKRNKIVLGVAGLIVVLAVAVALVVTQTPVGGLLGLSSYTIKPQNPTVPMDQSIGLTAVGMAVPGKWTVSDPNVLCCSAPGTGNIRKYFSAVGPGQTVVTFTDLFRGTGSTTVTVAAPPVISPANPTIGTMNWSISLSTGDPSTAWSIASGGDLVSLSQTSGASVVVSAGLMPGQATIKATTAAGSATTVVTLDQSWILFPLGYTQLRVGQTMEYGTMGGVSGSWTAQTTSGTPPVVSLSPTSGPATVVTAASAGTANIFLTIPSGARAQGQISVIP